MQHDGYNEFRQRGRFDFPIEFHHVDCHHPRFYMPYHWHMEYEIDLVIQGTLTLSLRHRFMLMQTISSSSAMASFMGVAQNLLILSMTALSLI